MRRERKLSFCQAENVLEEGFRSRNKFGMTIEAVLVLLVAPFVMSGTAWAQCTTAPNCTTLGYTKTSNTGNCLKCPTGNYYFCQEKIEESCPTKKRTIYGNCQIKYLVGYAVFCQKGHYYCQVQSNGTCKEITNSRVYDTDLLDFGAYPDQTNAQQRVKQLQNEIIEEVCETYNGNGESSSGGDSGSGDSGSSGGNCREYMSSATLYGRGCSCRLGVDKYRLIIRVTMESYDISGQVISSFDRDNYGSYYDTLEACEKAASSDYQCTCSNCMGATYSEICD